MGNPARLLIIGIDSADYRAMTQWLADGHLPHLAALMSHGQLLRCRSTRPPLSAPAWTTALTGCNPGKHGLYDFLDFSYPDRRPWWSLPRRCPSLWRRLSDAGLRCGVLNVPMTYPAEPINGVMVSGFGAPELTEQAFHPASLRQGLLAAVPGYSVQPTLDPALWPDVDSLIPYAAMRARAAAHLLETNQFDVFMVVFNSLDWAGHGHACRKDGDVLLRVMQAIDGQVGALVARTDWPKTPVLVMSDHGMRCAKRQVNLHKLFVDLGLLRVTERDEGSPPARTASTLIAAWNAAKRVLPARAIAWLRRVGHRQRAAALAAAPRLSVDWEHTIAAPVGAYGCIRLNVVGRDPNGTVAPEDYPAVRQDVIQQLQEVQDPTTGEPLFREVASRDDIYHGPLIESAPDIVLTPNSEDLAFGGATTDADLLVFMRQKALVAPLVPPCGVHADTGILMFSGEAAATARGSQECTLQEVAPTVLHLLGLPVPSYMDGRVLTEQLSGEPAARSVTIVDESLPAPEAAGAAYTSEEEERTPARKKSN